MTNRNTPWMTWFSSVRSLTPWDSRRKPETAGEPAGPAPAEPVGYLVNRKDGLTGSPGVGYDYVLAGNGLYVQAKNRDLAVRVLAARAKVRGLAPLTGKVGLANGLIPGTLFELGLRWMQAAPDTERFFAVRWDGEEYRLVMPEQEGTGGSLRYEPPTGTVAEFHSHPGMRAFFSKTDDRDEQGLRIYGVVGRVESMLPEVKLRAGVYGHFGPAGWPQVFSGPNPGVRLAGEGPE